jgi:hypothetical protein
MSVKAIFRQSPLSAMEQRSDGEGYLWPYNIGMPKPVAAWDEDDVLALPSGENDGFERKGSRLLDLTIPGVKQDEVLNELAKQLSSFANTGGGQIIYGVSDEGAIDNGGIARSMKGRQSTKEWLEDVVPTLTDYEIVGFNVYEIARKQSGSAIGPDKALYVVDVPDSDRAPHQSKRDHKYYVRLASKSQPASHRLIEDIRNRARHPRIEVCPRIIEATYIEHPNEDLDTLIILLEVGVQNSGRVMASHTALLFEGNFSLAISLGAGDIALRSSAKPGTGLMDLSDPIYPGMGIRVRSRFTIGAVIHGPMSGPRNGLLEIEAMNAEDAILTITSFADSAPPRTQEFKLVKVDPDSRLRRVVQNELSRRLYQK